MVIHALQPRTVHLNHPEILGPPPLLRRIGHLPTRPRHLLTTWPHNPGTKLLINRKLHPVVPFQHQIRQTPVVPFSLKALPLASDSHFLASKAVISILTLIIMIVMNKRKIEIT